MFGVSSGGPNAAVCARFLGERLTGCAIVSSPAPFDPTIPDDDTMLPMNRLGRRMVRRVPRFTGWMATTMAQITHLTPERMYEYAVRDLPEPDLAIARRPEVRADMIADFARAQPPTMMRTAVQDFTLEMHDWGFALGDIAMPVDVWHGDDDRNVPVRNGVRIAQAIPNATFHRLPNTGHWLFFTRAVEIMRAVAPH